MKQKKAKQKFYSLKSILSLNCTYNMIIGERSNGKTFAVQEKILEDYIKYGKKGAIIRRYELDFKGRNGQATFDGIINAGLVEKLTNGQWNTIKYYSGQWKLAKYDETLDKMVVSEDPFCYAFALTLQEHYKSTSYTKVCNILFDEFLTRQAYLPDEFITFVNVLSTIIRSRDNIQIFMLGNTVNKYSPYFVEMGIDINKLKQGEIDVVTYGNGDLKLAIEYCSTQKEGKASDRYFAFNNPKLNMITKGAWEMAIYPHLPKKYKNSDILLTYFIEFDRNTLQCEIIRLPDCVFTYIHRKTTPIRNKKDIVFSPEYSENPYRFRRITKPKTKIQKTIAQFYATERVFYQDNEVGEIIRNYIEWSNTEKIV